MMVKNEENALTLLEENHKEEAPVKVKFGDYETRIYVLAFDRVGALGKKGAVLSFYFEEE